MMTTLELPILNPGRARRYASALTGSWRTGDILVRHVSDICLAREPVDLSTETEEWFRIASSVWNSAVGVFIETTALKELHALKGERRRIAAMPRAAREVFLLTTLGGLSIRKAGLVTGRSPSEVAELLQEACARSDTGEPAAVMIVEDEGLIARDLERIVRDLGHEVSCKARTRDEAVAYLDEKGVDLVLADMQLLDGSSGIDAVNDMIAARGGLPVVFITAFPAQLIDSNRPGPTFLISKPFQPVEVRDAITRVLYFGIESSRGATTQSVDSLGPPLVRLNA
jgi:CheY-like chemotaxis protein